MDNVRRVRWLTIFTFGLFVILLVLLLLNESADQKIFLALNRAAAKLPDVLWANITLLGDGVFSVALLSLLTIKSQYFTTICLYCGMGMGVLIQGLKRFIGDERPAIILDNGPINIIGEALSYNSFPSGHTATVFFLAAAIITYFNIKNIKILLLITVIAALAGFSRIAVGVHFPSDVLCGALLGWFCGWLGPSLLANKRIAPPFIIIASILIFLTAASMFFYDPKLPFVTPLRVIAGIIFTAFAIYNIGRRIMNKSLSCC